MGKWGSGLFECDLDNDVGVQLSLKAGIKLYTSTRPRNDTPAVAKFPKRVLAHLNAGTFTKTFDFFKKSSSVPTFEVTNNYYVCLLGVYAMMLGANISEEQLAYMRETYETCGFMGAGIAQIKQMLAVYKSGTALMPERPNRTEERAQVNRGVTSCNFFGARYLAGGPQADFTGMMSGMMTGRTPSSTPPAQTTTTPEPQQSDSVCGNCHKSEEELSKPLKRCAKCQTTVYCSKDCQKQAWKSHKKVCAANAAKSANDKAGARININNGPSYDNPLDAMRGVFVGSRGHGDLPDGWTAGQPTEI